MRVISEGKLLPVRQPHSVSGNLSNLESSINRRSSRSNSTAGCDPVIYLLALASRMRRILGTHTTHPRQRNCSITIPQRAAFRNRAKQVTMSVHKEGAGTKIALHQTTHLHQQNNTISPGANQHKHMSKQFPLYPSCQTN